MRLAAVVAVAFASLFSFSAEIPSWCRRYFVMELVTGSIVAVMVVLVVVVVALLAVVDVVSVDVKEFAGYVFVVVT